ncbi:MAG: hypothetical protein QOD06_1927 [Candidatus Binatota bacterium]|jgi:hypothetical protein|nr:hypothetical protein [Candidatus Binatota bacterium]
MSRALPLLLAALLMASATPAWPFSNGIAGQTCTGSNCHNPQPLPITALCLEGLPDDAQYDPAKRYRLRITVHGINVRLDVGDPGAALAGFSLRAKTGTFFTIDRTTTLWNRSVVSHSAEGNRRTEWEVDWQPSLTAASETFTLAGNAVNGNRGNDDGDLWNRATFAASASPSPSATPGSFCTDPALPAPVYVPEPAH